MAKRWERFVEVGDWKSKIYFVWKAIDTADKGMTMIESSNLAPCKSKISARPVHLLMLLSENVWCLLTSRRTKKEKFLSASIATPRRYQWRRETLLSIFWEEVAAVAHFRLLRIFEFSTVSVFLIHKIVLRFLENCYCGGECHCRVTLSEKFLHRIQEANLYWMRGKGR